MTTRLQDQLYVSVRGSVLTFESFTLTRSVQRVPMSLSLTYADTFNSSVQGLFVPGDKITAYLGDILCFTGFVDSVHPRISAGASGQASHTVTMQARSGMRNLVDCSIDLLQVKGQVAYGNIEDIANTLAKPFGITVLNQSKQDLKLLPYGLQFQYGATPWSVIEEAARYAGVLLLDDENGNLVIADAGSKTMTTTAALGVNVEDISTNFSMAMRYSDIYVVFALPDSLSHSLPQASQRGEAHDPTIKEHRPLYIVSEQPDPNFDIGTLRAQWEVNHRLGAGYTAQITMSTWRDTATTILVPNALMNVDLTAAKVDRRTMVITSVTYAKSASGTRCTLDLTLPEALRVEPFVYVNPYATLIPHDGTATPSSAQITPATH